MLPSVSRVFQVVVRSGGNQKLYWVEGGGGLLGEGNLRSSDFDNSNLFQS